MQGFQFCRPAPADAQSLGKQFVAAAIIQEEHQGFTQLTNLAVRLGDCIRWCQTGIFGETQIHVAG